MRASTAVFAAFAALCLTLFVFVSVTAYEALFGVFLAHLIFGADFDFAAVGLALLLLPFDWDLVAAAALGFGDVLAWALALPLLSFESVLLHVRFRATATAALLAVTGVRSISLKIGQNFKCLQSKDFLKSMSWPPDNFDMTEGYCCNSNLHEIANMQGASVHHRSSIMRHRGLTPFCVNLDLRKPKPPETAASASRPSASWPELHVIFNTWRVIPLSSLYIQVFVKTLQKLDYEPSCEPIQ